MTGRLIIAIAAFWGLAVCATAAEPQLQEQRRGAFVIQAEFDLAEIAPELAELDRLVAEVSAALQLPKMKDLIAVRIFPDEESWRAFYKRKFAPAAYRDAIFERENYLLDRSGIKGRVYLHRNKYFLEDLRHECTHAILASSLGSVPVWLDEGIAEYFEPAPETRLRNPEWIERLAKRLAPGGGFLPLAKLEKASGMADMTTDKYCDAWAWVCFALHARPETRAALIAYLRDATAKKLFAAKLSKRLDALYPGGKAEDALRNFYGAGRTAAPTSPNRR